MTQPDSLAAIIAEMREPENSGQFGPWQFTADNIKDWADRLAALAGAAPDWVMLPRKLTAANGAKGLLSGEFHETVRQTCDDCQGEGYDDDGTPCEICEGECSFETAAPVSWDTIKRIHEMVVANLATPHAPAKAREVSEVDVEAAYRVLTDYGVISEETSAETDRAGIRAALATFAEGDFQ